jgi:hypothetical protein
MAHPDLDTLLNAVLPFAQQMLAKRGAFHPFGASMSSEGKVALAQAIPEGEQPESRAVIDMLTLGFQEQGKAGLLRATAICFDGRAVPPGSTEKVDAICVRLEHISAENAAVFLPYSKGWFGRVKYGGMFASAMESQVFGPHGAA